VSVFTVVYSPPAFQRFPSFVKYVHLSACHCSGSVWGVQADIQAHGFLVKKNR